ncbi:MAG: hypothetical protein WKF84_19075 [Pyrinomonadaceae bacterium]
MVAIGAGDVAAHNEAALIGIVERAEFFEKFVERLGSLLVHFVAVGKPVLLLQQSDQNQCSVVAENLEVALFGERDQQLFFDRRIINDEPVSADQKQKRILKIDYFSTLTTHLERGRNFVQHRSPTFLISSNNLIFNSRLLLM